MGKANGIVGFYYFESTIDRDDYFTQPEHSAELVGGITASCGTGDDWVLTQYALDGSGTVAPKEPGTWKNNSFKWVTIQSKINKTYWFQSTDSQTAKDLRTLYFNAHPEEQKTGIITYLLNKVGEIDECDLYVRLGFSGGQPSYAYKPVSKNQYTYIKGDRGETGYLNINYLGMWNPQIDYESNSMVTWQIDTTDPSKTGSYIALRHVYSGIDPLRDLNAAYYWAQTSSDAMASVDLNNLSPAPLTEDNKHESGEDHFSHLRPKNVIGGGLIKTQVIGNYNDDDTKVLITQSNTSLAIWGTHENLAELFNAVTLTFAQLYPMVGSVQSVPQIGDNVYADDQSTTSMYHGMVVSLDTSDETPIESITDQANLNTIHFTDFAFTSETVETAYVGHLNMTFKAIDTTKPDTYFGLVIHTNSTEPSDITFSEFTDATFTVEKPETRYYIYQNGAFNVSNATDQYEWDRDALMLRTSNEIIIAIADGNSTINPTDNDYIGLIGVGLNQVEVLTVDTPSQDWQNYVKYADCDTFGITPVSHNDNPVLTLTGDAINSKVGISNDETITGTKTIDVPHTVDTALMNWVTDKGNASMNTSTGLWLSGNQIHDVGDGVSSTDGVNLGQLNAAIDNNWSERLIYITDTYGPGLPLNWNNGSLDGWVLSLVGSVPDRYRIEFGGNLNNFDTFGSNYHVVRGVIERSFLCVAQAAPVIGYGNNASHTGMCGLVTIGPTGNRVWISTSDQPIDIPNNQIYVQTVSSTNPYASDTTTFSGERAFLRIYEINGTVHPVSNPKTK